MASRVDWLLTVWDQRGPHRPSADAAAASVSQQAASDVAPEVISRLREGSQPSPPEVAALAGYFGIPEEFFTLDADQTLIDEIREQMELLSLMRQAKEAGIGLPSIRCPSPDGLEPAQLRRILSAVLPEIIRQAARDT